MPSLVPVTAGLRYSVSQAGLGAIFRRGFMRVRAAGWDSGRWSGEGFFAGKRRGKRPLPPRGAGKR